MARVEMVCNKVNIRNQIKTIFQNQQRQPRDTNISIRATHEERQLLALLAQAYKMPQAQVLSELIYQAASDYEHDGEVLALLKINRIGD